MMKSTSTLLSGWRRWLTFGWALMLTLVGAPVGVKADLVVDDGASYTVIADITNDNVIVGKQSTGTLNQNGFTNTANKGVILGYDVGSSGTYKLGGGILSSNAMVVGHYGNGNFIQNGGTCNVPSNITMGGQKGTMGNYTLSNGNLVSHHDWLGCFGNCAFNQSGGSYMTTYLKLAVMPGSNCIYGLIGGTLSSDSIEIGLDGNGTFNQSGGTHTTNILSLGYAQGSNGAYNLNDGILFTKTCLSGVFGTGVFIQNGGTHNARYLLVGDNGYGYCEYTLNGGTLTAETLKMYYRKGTFNQTGGTVMISTADTASSNSLIQRRGSALLNGTKATKDTAASNGLSIRGGTFTIGDGGKLDLGCKTEIMVESGNFSVGEGGTLALCFDGGSSDSHIPVAPGSNTNALATAFMGSITLSGTLSLSLAKNYTPKIGDSFTVMSFGSRNGDFVTVTGDNLGGGLFLKKVYTATSMTLVVQGASNPAIDLLLIE